MVFYKVRYWDEFDQEETEENGAVLNDSTKIITTLENYYGKDNLCEIVLKYTEDTEYDLVTEEMFSEAFN